MQQKPGTPDVLLEKFRSLDVDLNCLRGCMHQGIVAFIC